jgi:methionine-rich copper-binding protein CopC
VIELRYACALDSNGNLRAADSVSECGNDETPVLIKPDPTLVCVRPAGSLRHVTSFSACGPQAARMTLPPTSGAVYVCAAASSGALRHVTSATRCTVDEVRYRVRPNDAAPSVTETSPSPGASRVGTTTDVSITFSEAVTAGPDAVSMTCAGVVEPSTLRGSPGTTLTIDPDDTLAAGVTCQVTVVGARIGDVDTNDPADNPSADSTFSFTTDSPPALSSSTPADGATAVAASGSVVLTFSEPVDVDSGALELRCSGSAHRFALSGSGTDVLTLDPDDRLPATSPCSVTAAADDITDADDGDPLDSLTAPIGIRFTTVDAAPSVIETSPADGAEGLGVATDFVVTFSEPVALAPDAFELTCGGQAAPFSTSGSGTTTIALDPIGDLPQGATCLVKIVASAVSDVDAVDPPDHPTGDSLVVFSTDTEPAVETTAPLNGDVGVDLGDDIVIGFTEDVSFSAASFELSCDGSPHAFTVSASGARTATIDPTGQLPRTATCVVTVLAAGVADADAADPPDTMAADHLFAFTTDDASPTIVSTMPVGGATDVSADSSVSVTFSESVTTSATAFALECPRASSVPFSMSGSPGSVITLDPKGSLPAGAGCTVTVTGSRVSDTDAVDPPDALADDYSFSFRVSDNATPTDISPSSTSIAENNPVDATVATLSTTDADPGDTFTYRLVGGTGSTDNASFSIVGSSLRAGVAFDHEAKSSYSIRIRTTDAAGAVYEEAVTIMVNDVTEVPSNHTPSGPSVP